MRQSLPQNIARAILEDYVESGAVKSGERLPSLRVLERQYATSRSTLAHALSLLEQQGRLQKRHGSGCYVTELPDSATAHAPTLIGYVAGNTDGEIVLRVYDGIERVCQQHGFHILVASSRGDYETEHRQIARMAAAGCRAIILYPISRTLAQLRADYLIHEFTELPIVLVDLAYPEQKRSQVLFDNFQGSFEMTEMLLRAGHQRIAFLDLDKKHETLMHYSTRERYRGYRAAMQAAGHAYRPEDHWIIRDRMPEDDLTGELTAFLSQWQTRENRATALIALEDTSAMQAIQTAQGLGIAVPSELCVTGFDNRLIARAFAPRFATTSPDLRRAGEVAMEIALQHLRGGQMMPITSVLPVPLEPRQADVTLSKT